MPRLIFSVDEVRHRLDEGAQLVDTLEEEEYQHSHIPGAINIPLKRLDTATASRLDRSRPVIVYCDDFG